MESPERWFMALAGVFAIVCALGDFEFFMGSRKAAFLVALLGRDGARVFYALLGVFIMAMALFFVGR